MINEPKEYVTCHEKTGLLELKRLPACLLPFAGKLTTHLTMKFKGEPVDEDLLYAMNWETAQWIAKALDDYV